jgi:UrcA family protein
MTMNRTTSIRTCTLGLALALNPVFVAAQQPVVVDAPQIEDDYKQARVSFTDLNLSTEAGAQALHARILAASGRVCEGVEHETYGRSLPVSWGKCRHVTYDAVKPKIEAVIATARAGQAVATSITIRRADGKS